MWRRVALAWREGFAQQDALVRGCAPSPGTSSQGIPAWKCLKLHLSPGFGGVLMQGWGGSELPIVSSPCRNGSVVVRGQALFRGDAPAPTSSHLIRTVVTEASRGRSSFSWRLEPRSVRSGGKPWRPSHSRAAAVGVPLVPLAKPKPAQFGLKGR